MNYISYFIHLLFYFGNGCGPMLQFINWFSHNHLVAASSLTKFQIILYFVLMPTVAVIVGNGWRLAAGTTKLVDLWLTEPLQQMSFRPRCESVQYRDNDVQWLGKHGRRPSYSWEHRDIVRKQCISSLSLLQRRHPLYRVLKKVDPRFLVLLKSIVNNIWTKWIQCDTKWHNSSLLIVKKWTS